MTEALLRFVDGSYGLSVGTGAEKHVYSFRGEDGKSYQEMLESVTLESVAWFHASSVFPDALPALSEPCHHPMPRCHDEYVEVEYDLSNFFFDGSVSYGKAVEKSARWQQAPTLVVKSWVEDGIPIARTRSDLPKAVQYAACTGGNRYKTVDSMNKTETKKVDKTFFSTHVLPKLDGTVVFENDRGIFVYKANVPHDSVTDERFGKHHCEVWRRMGQVTACHYH